MDEKIEFSQRLRTTMVRAGPSTSASASSHAARIEPLWCTRSTTCVISSNRVENSSFLVYCCCATVSNPRSSSTASSSRCSSARIITGSRSFSTKRLRMGLNSIFWLSRSCCCGPPLSGRSGRLPPFGLSP